MARETSIRRTRTEARRQRMRARGRFAVPRRVEISFGRQLWQVARQVGMIVNGLAPQGVVVDLHSLRMALARYSELLLPWARAVSARMVTEVAQRDEKAWTELGREIGQELRSEVRHAPTGEVMRRHMSEAVDLITSLPVEAAHRVHRLVIEGMESGTRAKETAAMIARTGEVTESRAMLIARTETSRAATALTEARARFVGGDSYVWRTSQDSDVRAEHRILEGKVFSWDEPPIAGPNGERYHPGSGPNCRCFPEVLIPDVV